MMQQLENGFCYCCGGSTTTILKIIYFRLFSHIPYLLSFYGSRVDLLLSESLTERSDRVSQFAPFLSLNHGATHHHEALALSMQKRWLVIVLSSELKSYDLLLLAEESQETPIMSLSANNCILFKAPNQHSKTDHPLKPPPPLPTMQLQMILSICCCSKSKLK